MNLIPSSRRNLIDFGASFRNFSRLAGGDALPPSAPINALRYLRPASSLSCVPWRGLFGIQATPPEKAVDPPNTFCFSMISGERPSDLAASAAGTDAAPLPTITKSKLSSYCINPTLQRAVSKLTRVNARRAVAALRDLIILLAEALYLISHD